MKNRYINRIALTVLSLATVLFVTSCQDQEIELANKVDLESYEVMYGVHGKLLDALTNKNYKEIYLSGENHTEQLHFVLSKPQTDAEISVAFDAEYLTEYNEANGTEILPYPAANIAIVSIGKATSAEYKIEISVFANSLEGELYAIPLKVTAKGVTVAEGGANMMYVVKGLSESFDENGNLIDETDKGIVEGKPAVRPVIYIPTNDVNPLNVLEIKLESGELFFDDVILFSSNINYNAATGRVHVFNNPNIQNLLNNSDKLIQPLRRKGIKVFLSLLGNHDPAGLKQLSDLGIEMFVKDVKAMVDLYQLDGVAFDDEYSKPPLNNHPLFSPKSNTQLSRLVYECHKAMPDKQMMLYYFNGIYAHYMEPVDGVAPGDYVDYVVPDYPAGSAAPVAGMGLDRCAGASIELAYNRGNASETHARNKRNAGYGYYMFFSLNPANYFDFKNQYGRMNSVSKGLFEQEIVPPTHYYAKNSDVRHLIE